MAGLTPPASPEADDARGAVLSAEVERRLGKRVDELALEARAGDRAGPRVVEPALGALVRQLRRLQDAAHRQAARTDELEPEPLHELSFSRSRAFVDFPGRMS